MAKRVQINLSSKLYYVIVALVILILLTVGVSAYGGSEPTIMGHSGGEINGTVIEPRTTDPASPVVGQMWLRTDIP